MQITLPEYGSIFYALGTAAGTMTWFLFLQLTVSSLLRRIRPRMLISLDAGRGSDSNIVVANHSEHTINLSASLITVRFQTGETVEHATNILNLLPDERYRPGEPEAYGLLRHGQAVTLAPLGTHIAMTIDHTDLGAIDRVEVCLVANHGVDMTLFGAETSLDVDPQRDTARRTPSIRQQRTRQRRHWWHRRRLRRILERAET